MVAAQTNVLQIGLCDDAVAQPHARLIDKNASQN
jgi:hypothetical protein